MTDIDTGELFDSPNGQAPPTDTAEASFACEVCGAVLPTEGGLRRHRTRIHGLSTPKTSGAPRKASGGRRDTLKEGVDGFSAVFYGMGGMALSRVDPVCGPALAECQDAAAAAWYQAAKRNGWLAEFFKGSSKASVWALVVAAHLPFLMAVQAHHLPGLLPPQQPAEPTADLGEAPADLFADAGADINP